MDGDRPRSRRPRRAVLRSVPGLDDDQLRVHLGRATGGSPRGRNDPGTSGTVCRNHPQRHRHS